MAMEDRPSQDVRDWISDEVRGLQCHRLRLLSLHNSTLPLHHLPAEILVEILRQAFGQNDRKWMAKAAGVCRHWRDVVISTPLLWSNIDLSMTSQYMKLCLARSQEASLRIYVPPDEPHETPDPSAIFSILSPHHPRISQVDTVMRFPSAFHRAALRHMVEDGLPALTSLRIETLCEYTLQLTNSHMPNVRKLSLSGVTLQWISWPLPGLTSLCLLNVTHSRGSDQARGSTLISHILDVLEACSSLETLKYEQMLGPAISPESYWSGISDKRVVSLPCLQDLSLKTSSADGAAVILAHVAFLRKVRISVRVGESTYQTGEPLDASLLTTILPSDATRLPIIAHARHITVWSVGRGLSVWVDEDARSWGYTPSDDEDEPEPPTLSLGFGTPMRGSENEMFHNVVSELCSVFPSSLESLILNGPVHLLDIETWNRVLTAFPLLQYLELYSTLHGLKDFVSVLKPRADTVPWARLQDLYWECALPPQPAEQDTAGDDTVDLEILKQLRVVLQERGEANSRLKHLYIDLKSTANTPLHSVPPDSHTTASNPMPPAVEEVRLELSSVVDSLELYN